jgi:hypothetical protein
MSAKLLIALLALTLAGLSGFAVWLISLSLLGAEEGVSSGLRHYYVASSLRKVF